MTGHRISFEINAAAADIPLDPDHATWHAIQRDIKKGYTTGSLRDADGEVIGEWTIAGAES